ncbi:hypothetical protein DOY81_008775, partial [Sarcophaga bullata]
FLSSNLLPIKRFLLKYLNLLDFHLKKLSSLLSDYTCCLAKYKQDCKFHKVIYFVPFAPELNFYKIKNAESSKK